MNLDHAMRQIVCEMTLLSYGRTQALNASGGRSENPDPRPAGEAHPLADEWAAAWRRDPSHATLETARAELEAWKKRTAPVTDSWDERKAILDEGEGFAVDVVARRFARTPTYVRRLRLRAEDPKRESEFGLPVDGVRSRAESKAEDRVRVLNLAGQGCTLKQIETQTRVPRETVRRWMKEAA